MASLFANSCAILLFKCITFADKNIVAAPKIVSSFTEFVIKKERAGVFTTAARLPETNSVKLLTQT